MKNKKPRVANLEECQARLAELPEFSAKVYEAIHSGLYAEPFFSDVRVEDVAKKLNVAPRAVNAAVGHLIEEGLIYTENFDGNDWKRVFLHTYQHDQFHDI
jgi:hypothetical protein